jgi:hypothetical protein
MFCGLNKNIKRICDSKKSYIDNVFIDRLDLTFTKKTFKTKVYELLITFIEHPELIKVVFTNKEISSNELVVLLKSILRNLGKEIYIHKPYYVFISPGDSVHRDDYEDFDFVLKRFDTINDAKNYLWNYQLIEGELQTQFTSQELSDTIDGIEREIERNKIINNPILYDGDDSSRRYVIKKMV